MKSRAIEAILFDFDGTLAPNLDLPDMRRRVIDLTVQQSVPEPVYIDCYIVEIIDAASDWLRAHGESDKAEKYYQAAHQLIIDIELDEAKGTSPFPQVQAYLQNLQAAGIATGVVTRNCRAAVYEVFPDIDQHIHSVCARDDVDFFKPDPRHLTECLGHLSVIPENAAMIGDGRMDMSVGKELGMYCVGVCSGSSSAEELKNAGADVVFEYCYEFQPGSISY